LQRDMPNESCILEISPCSLMRRGRLKDLSFTLPIVYNSKLNRIPATGAHISDLKPYLEYKDSGVEGIRKVPEQEYKAKIIFQTGLTG
ncbi:hypothetical protein ig2599ANME_0974, partial [groundwater metagenome]